MKSIILLKKTPDTEAKIKLSSDNRTVDHGETKFIINPYDEFAIEEALKVKENNGGAGEVVVLSFGSKDVKDLIIKALAMGADRGVLVDNEGLEDVDSLTIAKVLAAALKAENPDLVFCGKQAIDDDNMHVAPMVAELLGWPHINVVNAFKLDGRKAVVDREIEGGQVEKYETSLPVVIGANKSLNNPRYASLPGIMKAKKKPFDSKSISDLGLDKEKLKSQVKAKVRKFSYLPQKPAGKLFKGEDVKTMVDKVANLLRDEAKIL